jgi:acyl dehydratase
MRFGPIAVETDEVLSFAKRFDPQTMHTDLQAAKHTPFGGLIATRDMHARGCPAVPPSANV